MQLNDSQRSAVETELGQVATEAYNVPREDLRATTFVPRQDNVREWAESYSYPIFKATGMAKFIADYAQDLPPVNTVEDMKTVLIKLMGDSYSYSEPEIMSWLEGTSGRNLDRERAEEARRKIDEKVDLTIMKGDTDAGFTGLINNGNVSSAVIPADGEGGSTAFNKKTLDKITASIQAVLDVVKNNTKGPNGGACIKADSVIFPTSTYNFLSRTKSNDGVRYLDYIKSVFADQGVKYWYEHELLETAGTSNGTRMIAYKNDKRVLSYILPIPFKQKNAQEKALSYNVPCYARCGGVVFKRIKAIAYGDGV